MATARGNTRLQVGSAPWIAEERASSLQIATAETEEFTFSARNEIDWLNEHMSEIFSKNQVNVAEIFKTPGKLRGKTPRTVRKNNPLETREPLSDVFTSTPRGEPSPFTQLHFDRPATTFQVAEDEPEVPVTVATSSNTAKASPPKPSYNVFDSGYHGSQPDDATQSNEPYVPTMEMIPSPERPGTGESTTDGADSEDNAEIVGRDSETRRTTEGSFQSAKEDQTRNQQAEPEAVEEDEEDEEMAGTEVEAPLYPVLTSPLQGRRALENSPQKRSPQRNTPARPSPLKEMTLDEVAETPEPALPHSPVRDAEPAIENLPVEEDEVMEDAQSQSDGSSPMRPIVRKSSLNFASLPAREPITSKKSIGNRVSRTSHIAQSRPSYYGRLTGGKSMGNAKQDEDEDEEMEVEQEEDADTKMTREHNKTSTQRLQDQISMLAKSQTNKRPSKSLVKNVNTVSNEGSTGATATQEALLPKSPRKQSPQHRERPPPGAFPEDEEDSWIGPPPETAGPPSIFSPRPQMTKSHTADIMEEIQSKVNASTFQYDVPKRGQSVRSPSPRKEVPSSPFGHKKSVSTSVIRSPRKAGESPEGKKGISVSNPAPPVNTLDEEESATSPPKSPGRTHRGSPLKAAKDKFSSILKSSRGLFASSAAASAEAKTSNLPTTSSKTDLRTPSFEDVITRANDSNSMYPNLEAHTKGSQLSLHMPKSPFKSGTRKTRASTEREERKKLEEAKELKEAKEVKEAMKLDSQLEKARSKVRDDARKDFVAQERAATVQKEVLASQEFEAQAKPSQIGSPRATRSSPRKTKAQLEAEGIAAAAVSTDEMTNRDIEMADASQTMPPPAIPRPKSQIGRPGPKRPLKPTKEPVAKVAKPPTVIKVDTGSQRGQPYHPSTSTLAATLQESLGSSQSSVGSQPGSQTLKHKSSASSIQSKASTSSFKSVATKTLEAAAKRREQEEIAAQKRREAKQENDRQRAAIKEEEKRKEEQQRRQEIEKQREVQRERERLTAQADAKRAAQRQAIEKRRLEMERAKETRAPPPAIRPPPVDHAALEKALPPLPSQRDAGPPRPIRMNTAVQRTQDEPARPASVMRNNTTKAPPKRPLQQENERPAAQRNGPSYQTEHESKRRRTSDNFDDDEEPMQHQPRMTAPPIRQSSSRQKELPTKSLFPSGYANAPPPASLQRSTLITQHNMNQANGAHPMDMAQMSKGPIPFATNPNQAASQHKTPARPGVPSGSKSLKSAAKSSPRYQNGENIVLPEINTDSEDSDSEAPGDFPVQGWTNSPDLRKALVMQETIDPAAIFGQPGPLNMEEVFSKSKDRWHKFRNRTSSANWSGTDRLTEDDVRKDLEARDKVRRQGGWTYDSMV